MPRIRVPFFPQATDDTCGPACLRMLFAFYGRRLPEAAIARSAGTTHHMGTSRKGLLCAALRHGFSVHVNARATGRDIAAALRESTPLLVSFREPSHEMGHYAVITAMTRTHVILHDPWNGEGFHLPLKEFQRRWLGYRRRRKDVGWLLFIAPREPLIH